LTRTVVGTGTSNGINYIDIRFNGTTSGVIDIQVKPDGNGGLISGSTGQSWTESSWVAIVGGSTANIADQWLVINEYSAGPTYLRTSNVVSNILAGGATLTRVSGASTLGASTTIVEPVIVLRTGSSVAIDITLRIGLPQLEQGAFATSVIPTTTTALTRAADVASVNTLSPWYNASEGTAYAEVALIGLSATANQNALQFSDGTSSNRIALYRQSAALSTALSFGTTINGSSWTTTAIRKIALGNKSGDSALADSGAIAGTGVGTTVQNVNQLRLGSNHDGTGGFTNGYLRRITYYPTRLSNAQLQAITT
jgi:hypothetical protein